MMRTSRKFSRALYSTMRNDDPAITRTWQRRLCRSCGLVFRFAERLSDRYGTGSAERPVPYRHQLLLFDFNSIDVSRAVHVGAEDDPFHVGRECDVRFERVIVLCQIDQLFDLQGAVLRCE